MQQVLPPDQGQNVVSVEIAGRPDLDQERAHFTSDAAQGQWFSRAKSDQSIAALKSRAQLEDVQVEIRPQADGVRVLLVCQPAFYLASLAFRAPRANSPTRACYRFPTTRHGDHIQLSIWRLRRPHSLGSFNRTATSKLKSNMRSRLTPCIKW